MTDSVVSLLAALTIALPATAALLTQAPRTGRAANRINVAAAAVSSVVAVTAGVAMIVHPAHPGGVLITDAVAGIYVLIITAVALVSALLSPAYLARSESSRFFPATRRVRSYYLAFYAFWAALAAIPMIANLGVAWLVVEVSTAASAVLVAFSGKPRALEAGWKYLILTTLGMSVAFLGIVILYVASAHGGSTRLDWWNLPHTLAQMPHHAAAAAYGLVLLGLATKIGWAPVHNWLPDAHSEAPAPVSAMLSSALLPTVMLLAWRLRDAATPALGFSAATLPLTIFGMVSVAVAVPFLWRPMAWKRLLAYHSLEHMGIITVGIAVGTPLAVAGVVIHVAGHALSKALGFFAAIPLYEVQPDAAEKSAHDVAGRSPATYAAMAVTALTLAGLPPSPLFFSELFILGAAVQTGQLVLAGALGVLIALAFVGLLHAILEATEGGTDSPGTEGADSPANERRQRTAPIVTPTLVYSAALLVLTALALPLAGSAIIGALARGIS